MYKKGFSRILPVQRLHTYGQGEGGNKFTHGILEIFPLTLKKYTLTLSTADYFHTLLMLFIAIFAHGRSISN